MGMNVSDSSKWGVGILIVKFCSCVMLSVYLYIINAIQVASGLAYLHDHNIVYYDLKSPNVLVFQYPSAQDSLQASQIQDNQQEFMAIKDWPVLVKIADMGISRRLTPGGVMGFKGSPGFMAPEILKYVGTEAVTEKVRAAAVVYIAIMTIYLCYV